MVELFGRYLNNSPTYNSWLKLLKICVESS